jgi:predicted transport protein
MLAHELLKTLGISIHKTKPYLQWIKASVWLRDEFENNMVSKGKKCFQVSNKIVVYADEDHNQKGGRTVQELASTLKDRIMDLDDLTISPVKHYIGFKLNKRVFADFEVQKTKLKTRINLKKGKLDDPKNLFRKVANIGNFGVGAYEVIVREESDLDYLMSLINQS